MRNGIEPMTNIDWTRVLNDPRESTRDYDDLETRIKKIIARAVANNTKLAPAKVYEHIIISFIKQNINEEELVNNVTLSSIIYAYYEILVNREVGLDKYLFLQDKMNNPYNNEILREIERRYLDAKNVLLSSAKLFEIKVADFENEDDIINAMIIKYEDTKSRERIYSSVYMESKDKKAEEQIEITKMIIALNKSFETVRLIRSCNKPIIEKYRINTGNIQTL
jgi:hypothetical protein